MLMRGLGSRLHGLNKPITRHPTLRWQHSGDGLIYPAAPSRHHSDLASFLAYADRVGLDRDSTVFRGTLYEYTVGQSLARYGFHLRRVGGAGDGGIDLVGTWRLPDYSQAQGRPQVQELAQRQAQFRVLMQCKAVERHGGPRLIRELEGAFVGAPAGWNGASVLGFMVSTAEATRGTREALGRSRRPMGYVVCGEDGGVRQMLWNQRAEEEGLEGVGVVMRYGDGRGELVLVRDGVPVPLCGPS